VFAAAFAVEEVFGQELDGVACVAGSAHRSVPGNPKFGYLSTAPATSILSPPFTGERC
jgi:hypothetical protein